MNLRTRPSTKQIPKLLVSLLAVILIGFGAWGLAIRYIKTHQSNPTIPTETVTYSTEEPAETPPTAACETYQVPDDQPKKIEIPSLGASGCIQKVGIDQNAAIAVPTNIHIAGWFTNSAIPGEKGQSIIDGHVSGKYAPGIFSNLKNMQPGQNVKVQLGDGTWREFVVKAIETYPENQTMDKIAQQKNDQSRDLVLITCGGLFDSNSQSYSDRVVVYTTVAQSSSPD